MDNKKPAKIKLTIEQQRPKPQLSDEQRLKMAEAARDRWVAMSAIRPAKAPEKPKPDEDLLEWARKGDPESQSELGLWYSMEGRNRREAVRWYAAAAKQGDSWSQCELARAHRDGEFGAKKDISLALKWWKKAAAQGEAGALFDLGELYLKGVPGRMKPDQRRAIAYFEKAWEQRLYLSGAHLGWIYYRQKKHDCKRIFEIFTEVANAGWPEGMHGLAVLYRDGHCKEKDLEQAMFWLSAAVEAGDYESMPGSSDLTEDDEGLRALFSGADLKRIDRMAREWVDHLGEREWMPWLSRGGRPE